MPSQSSKMVYSVCCPKIGFLTMSCSVCGFHKNKKKLDIELNYFGRFLFCKFSCGMMCIHKYQSDSYKDLAVLKNQTNWFSRLISLFFILFYTAFFSAAISLKLLTLEKRNYIC